MSVIFYAVVPDVSISPVQEVFTVRRKTEGAQMLGQDRRAITRSCVDTVVVSIVGSPVRNVGAVILSYAPPSVSCDLDFTHLLVCEVNQGSFLKVDCG